MKSGYENQKQSNQTQTRQANIESSSIFSKSSKSCTEVSMEIKYGLQKKESNIKNLMDYLNDIIAASFVHK